MKVFPELTKNAWKVLVFLSKTEAKPSEISRSTGMPLSKVSISVKQLIDKKVLKQRKGYEKITIDGTLKNAIKNFLDWYGKDRLVNVFWGMRLNLLFQVSEKYDTSKKLRLVTGYSESTVKRILKELQDALLVYQPKIGRYRLRDAEKDKVNLLKSVFIAHFLGSLSAQGIEFKEHKIFGDIVFITSAQEKIPNFVKTGFSLFYKYDIMIFEPSHKYFVSFDREPTKEEVFLHTLVFSLDHQRNMILCMLFAYLNKLNFKKLEKLPLIYKVENEVNAISEFLKTKGQKRAEFLPRYQDYEEIRRDYERT